MRALVNAFRFTQKRVLRNQLSQRSYCQSYFERSRKGSSRYETDEEMEEWLKTPFSEKVRIKTDYLKKNVKLWTEEWIEKLRNDPKELVPGDRDIKWRFRSPEDCKPWIISADSDWNEGYSSGKLEISPQGYGVFHGKIDTNLPKDGRVDRAGWVSMSFKCPKRPNTFDWDEYSHIIMRVRGDGRRYSINLRMPGYFDIHWLDLQSYSLFTRGGPYWQDVRIPFSKFINTHKGRVQDDQNPYIRSKINEFGIVLRENVDGHFKLEIDYIGVEYDPSFLEESAYEMYKIEEFQYKV